MNIIFLRILNISQSVRVYRRNAGNASPSCSYIYIYIYIFIYKHKGPLFSTKCMFYLCASDTWWSFAIKRRCCKYPPQQRGPLLGLGVGELTWQAAGGRPCRPPARRSGGRHTGTACCPPGRCPSTRCTWSPGPLRRTTPEWWGTSSWRTGDGFAWVNELIGAGSDTSPLK